MQKNALSLIIFSIFLIGCGGPSADLLIDSFEGEISPQSVDFGAGEGSTLMVSADRDLKVCGEQSIKLDYNLRPSGYMWAARGYNLDVKGAALWLVEPQDIGWKKYQSISVYMYGNNSGGVVAFDIKDKGGEIWRYLLDDDFSGWKEIVCLLSGFFPRGDWQPEDADRNEILDFPVLSFQFEPRLPGKGVYRFDCVTLTGRKQ